MTDSGLGREEHASNVFTADADSIAAQVVRNDRQLSVDDLGVVVGPPVDAHHSANVVVDTLFASDVFWLHAGRPETPGVARQTGGVGTRNLSMNSPWSECPIGPRSSYRRLCATPTPRGASMSVVRLQADPLAFRLAVEVHGKIGVDEEKLAPTAMQTRRRCRNRQRRGCAEVGSASALQSVERRDASTPSRAQLR